MSWVNGRSTCVAEANKGVGSHATKTGLESAGEKQLNPTVSELIENLLEFWVIEGEYSSWKRFG